MNLSERVVNITQWTLWSLPRPFAVWQNSGGTPLLNRSTENFGERIESTTAAVAGISAHLGGDVRQYPVMEEEDEGQEEEDIVDFVGNPEKAASPRVQEQGEENHQTNHDNEDEDSRRARVNREWEAIDQV